MSHSWKQPVRILAAAALAVLLGFTLVPQAMGTAAVQEGAARGKLLKPNLVVLKARDLYIQRTGSGRYLRFAASLANIGRGPIEVRPNTNQPCARGHHHATQIIYRDGDGSGFYRHKKDTQVSRRSAGCMVFHPAHDHWHFKAASRYTLFQPGEQRRVVRVAHRKMSFCLRDSNRVPASYGTFHQPQFYGACSKFSPQGISVGWLDTYQSFLPGQSLRLPASARNGLYCLMIKVDPLNQLLESDDEDNSAVRAFTLKGDRIAFQSSARCR